MAYRAAGGDTGDMSRDTLYEKQQRKGICAPCMWFKESPLRRWQFILMLLFGLLTPVWIFLRLTGSLTGDIAAGASGAVLAIYAARHFRILLGLKEQVDKFANSNEAFKKENIALETEVSKLTKARTELTEVSRRLQQTTKSYEDNITKFKALDQKLSKLADDNIEGLEKLKEMTGSMQKTIEKELIQHSRAILLRVQESMEFGDDKEGLNQEEWNRFISNLPSKAQTVFKQMDFLEISGPDDILDFAEFTQLIDDTVTMEAVNKMKSQ